MAKIETWCDRDDHKLFEYFADFNEWLDSDEGSELCEANGIGELSQRSKAFYAGDKEAYDQAFKQYEMSADTKYCVKPVCAKCVLTTTGFSVILTTSTSW